MDIGTKYSFKLGFHYIKKELPIVLLVLNVFEGKAMWSPLVFKTCLLNTPDRDQMCQEKLVNLFGQRESAFQDYLTYPKEDDNAHFKQIWNMANSLKKKKRNGITRHFLRKIKQILKELEKLSINWLAGLGELKIL